MNTNANIFTYTGKYVHLMEPRAETIDIIDIAHALSQISRFGGHTRTFYSVAQHSIGVAQLVPVKYRLQALLHDAAEAYFGDMVQPLKCLPVSRDYRDHESWMQATINDRFGLGLVQDQECIDHIRQADLIMLATERRDLMAPDMTPWPILHDIKPRMHSIRPMLPIPAESAFLQYYKTISGSL
jgi:uncharacterized protein